MINPSMYLEEIVVEKNLKDFRTVLYNCGGFFMKPPLRVGKKYRVYYYIDDPSFFKDNWNNKLRGDRKKNKVVEFFRNLFN